MTNARRIAQRHRGRDASVASVFDSTSALACASAVFILGSLSTLVTPALLQGWADQFGWTETRLGWLATVELGGTALGSLSAFFWQRLYDWRRVAALAILLIVAANVASPFAAFFPLLCTARFVSGVAGGALLGVYTAYLSNTRSPEKFLAATTLAQILVQAAVMAISSVLLERWGMRGMYVLLSSCVVVLLPFLGALPRGWPAAPRVATAPAPRNWALGIFVLAAFVPFEMFQGGTFAFLHQFGEGAHLASSETLRVIGLSAIGSGLGPVAAYLLAERAGVARPLAGGLLVAGIAMIGLASRPYSASLLLFYLCVLQAAWLFATCYLYAALIKVNNLLTQAASSLSMLCLAGGAGLMGRMVETRGLDGMVAVALACLALAALLALPTLYLAERRLRFPDTSVHS